jgi:hypothetical protein
VNREIKNLHRCLDPDENCPAAAAAAVAAAAAAAADCSCTQAAVVSLDYERRLPRVKHSQRPKQQSHKMQIHLAK